MSSRTSCSFASVRPASRPAHADAEWLQTAPLAVDGVEVAVNKYFLNHPEMVLGTWSRKDTLYGTEGYSVTSNGELAEQLRQAVQRLPEYAPAPAASIEDDHGPLSRRSLGEGGFTPPPPDKHIGEGSFFVRPDRTICQSQSGLSLPVNYGGKTLTADGTLTRPAARRPDRPARPGPPRP